MDTTSNTLKLMICVLMSLLSLQGGPSLEQRFESYYNYCNLFNYILSESGVWASEGGRGCDEPSVDLQLFLTGFNVQAERG